MSFSPPQHPLPAHIGVPANNNNPPPLNKPHKSDKLKKSKKPTKHVEYEVEQIRAVRHSAATNETWCLIKWVGYDDTQMTWEPLDNLHADELLQEARDHLAYPNAMWEWKYFMNVPMNGRAAGWHPYDAAAQVCMNKYFRSYCNDCSNVANQHECVLSGKSQYNVNVQTMMQKNMKVNPYTERPITCIPISNNAALPVVIPAVTAAPLAI